MAGFMSSRGSIHSSKAVPYLSIFITRLRSVSTTWGSMVPTIKPMMAMRKASEARMANALAHLLPDRAIAARDQVGQPDQGIHYRVEQIGNHQAAEDRRQNLIEHLYPPLHRFKAVKEEKGQNGAQNDQKTVTPS